MQTNSESLGIAGSPFASCFMSALVLTVRALARDRLRASLEARCGDQRETRFAETCESSTMKDSHLQSVPPGGSVHFAMPDEGTKTDPSRPRTSAQASATIVIRNFMNPPSTKHDASC